MTTTFSVRSFFSTVLTIAFIVALGVYFTPYFYEHSRSATIEKGDAAVQYDKDHFSACVYKMFHNPADAGTQDAETAFQLDSENRETAEPDDADRSNGSLDPEMENDIRTLTRAQEEERWLETRAQIAAQQAEQERAQAEKARIDRLAEEIGFDLDQFKADAQKIAEALPGVNAAKIANAETAYDAFVAFETFYAQAKIGAKYNEAGKDQCRKNAAQMKRAYNALKAVNEEFQTAAN